MSLKLLITPLAEKKFDVFFRYLEDDYKRKYDALLFFKDEIILANEKDLNKLVYDIYNAINEKFNSEIIAKKIVKEGEGFLIYYTYLFIRSYEIQLTCIEKFDENLVSIEDVLIKT